MTSAMIRMMMRRENGKKIIEMKLPRRVLTAIKTRKPSAIRFVFDGVKETFEIDASAAQKALVETYQKKKKKKGRV